MIINKDSTDRKDINKSIDKKDINKVTNKNKTDSNQKTNKNIIDTNSKDNNSKTKDMMGTDQIEVIHHSTKMKELRIESEISQIVE
jgi:hypothetical protein